MPSNRIGRTSRACRRGYAGQSVAKMKAKTRQARVRDKRLSNEQVRREIQSFLHALKSYPGRFAKDPHVSFEEHHGGVVRAASTRSRLRM
jgi:hypothetical protein